MPELELDADVISNGAFGDEDYLFDTLEEAETKASELQESDSTGRKYKAIPSNNNEWNTI